MVEEISAKDFLDSRKDFFLLDVRTAGEWSAFHDPDSSWIPLNELLVRINEIPKDKKIAVICRSGSRSGFAAHLLREKGFNASNLTGGLKALVSELHDRKVISLDETTRLLDSLD